MLVVCFMRTETASGAQAGSATSYGCCRCTYSVAQWVDLALDPTNPPHKGQWSEATSSCTEMVREVWHGPFECAYGCACAVDCFFVVVVVVVFAGFFFLFLKISFHKLHRSTGFRVPKCMRWLWRGRMGGLGYMGTWLE